MKHAKLFEQAVDMQLSGNRQGARAAYMKLLRDFPNNSEVLGNLAVIIRAEGKTDVAEMMLDRAIRANPRNVAAMATLANIRLREKRFDEAWEITQRALAINPNYSEAVLNAGVVLVHRDQLTKAEEHFRKAMALDPKNFNAQMNLANVHRLKKINLDESLRILEVIAQSQPDNAAVLLMLGHAYIENFRYVDALRAFEKGLLLIRDEEFLGAKGNMHVVLGEMEQAIDTYEEALRINPDNFATSGTFLFTLNYDNRKTSADVFLEYEKYAKKMNRGKPRMSNAGHPPTAGRRIRIGYCSPDFYSHVVSFFIEPILKLHDRAQFELFAYANVIKPDDHTKKLKTYFDHWTDIIEMDDDEVAKRIHDDRIDVLIDLAGHTQGNRLSALAMHPAAVQATYLGYGYTTGMKEIDYFIGDENFTPEGCEPYFSEKVHRIPAPVYAYQPPRVMAPAVEELPALRKGYVTFGSMSRIIRFNNSLLKVWLRILDQVPGSKLRIDQKPLDDAGTRERFMLRLESLGYRREQVELVSSKPHWNGYHEFDISLDCWPHNAGTTTFDSLWMGVPVVSKRDRPSVGRLGAMVLEPAGLGNWVVDTEEEFVDKAVAFASDLPALAHLRKNLRSRIETSPFLDHIARTRGLEDAYRAMMARFEEEHA